MESQRISFLDYLLIFMKWKKFILINFFVVCSIAAVMSLIVPKWYSATATLLPPTPESDQLGISSMIGGRLSSLGGLTGIGGTTEDVAQFMAILESRTLMEKIVRKFNLIERYNAEDMEGAVKSLRERLSKDITENGAIQIKARAKTSYLAGKEEDDKVRALAKSMANFIVQTLDDMNTKFKVEKAKNNRIFIEKRYLQTLNDLKNTEERFKKFQEKYKAISLPEQTAASIKVMAELKAQIAAKEIEMGYLKKSVSHTHPSFIRTKIELNEMQTKYDEFLFSADPTIKYFSENSDASDIFIPINEVPDILLQYGRLFRELEILQKLLEILIPEYEHAKIQEAKDTPTVQVLDEAVPPVLRDSPKRAITVIISGFVSLLLSFMVVIIREYMNTLRNEDYEKYQKIEIIYSEIKHIFRKRKKN